MTTSAAVAKTQTAAAAAAPPTTTTTLHTYRVYGVRAEGNCDPAGDVHGELLNQNCLFKAESIKDASDTLQV